MAVLTTAASLGSTQELGPAPPSKRAARWALVRVRVRVMVRVMVRVRVRVRVKVSLALTLTLIPAEPSPAGGVFRREHEPDGHAEHGRRDLAHEIVQLRLFLLGLLLHLG